MLPYYVLILMPAAFYAVLGIARVDSKQRTRITVDIFFFIMLLLLAFRSEYVGTDIIGYKNHFYNYAVMSFDQIAEGILSGQFETGYVLLCRLIGLFTDNFRYVLIACALISLIPVWYFYRREEKHGYFLVVMFANVAPFTMYFSGLRQSMAMALAIPAYYFCRDRKIFKFLICVFAAFLFHRSALILLLMYPVFNMRIKKPAQFLLLLPPIALVFAFKTQIFSFLLNFSGDVYYSRYALGVRETGAGSVFLFLIALTVMSFILPSSDLLNDDDIGLRNILVVATVLQVFAGVHSLAMRMNYYFLLFVPVAVSRCLGKCDKNKKIADLALICLICFMSIYFFYHAYTDKDILQVFPYAFMF